MYFGGNRLIVMSETVHNGKASARSLMLVTSV